MNIIRHPILLIEEKVTIFCRWVHWLTHGKKVLTYPGYNCGCCGKWIEKEFSIPAYKSDGTYWDTIGLCDGGCKNIKHWNRTIKRKRGNYEQCRT